MSDIQTTDWLTFTPANAVGKRRAYIDLPVFSVTGLTWKGASEVVLQYNFSASSNFVLTTVPTKPSTANYGLCIRFRVGSTTYRYKLWRDNNFVLNDSSTPLYSGQVILKNFVLEIWSFNGETTADNAAVYRVITGVRTPRTNLRDSADYALAVGTAFNTFGNQTAAQGLPTYAQCGVTSRWQCDALTPGNIATWADDLSGFADTFSTASGAGSVVCKDPDVDDDLFNGHQYIALTASGRMNMAESNVFPRVFYLCLQVAEFAAASELFSMWKNSGSGTNFNAVLRQVAPTPDVRLSNTVGGTNSSASSGLVLNVPQIVRITVNADGALCAFRASDNSSVVTVDLGISSTNIDSFLYSLGKIVGTGVIFYVAEMLMCDNSNNEDLVYAYLKQKYLGATPTPITYDSGVAWLDNP